MQLLLLLTDGLLVVHTKRSMHLPKQGYYSRREIEFFPYYPLSTPPPSALVGQCITKPSFSPQIIFSVTLQNIHTKIDYCIPAKLTAIVVGGGGSSAKSAEDSVCVLGGTSTQQNI